MKIPIRIRNELLIGASVIFIISLCCALYVFSPYVFEEVLWSVTIYKGDVTKQILPAYRFKEEKAGFWIYRKFEFFGRFIEKVFGETIEIFALE